MSVLSIVYPVRPVHFARPVRPVRAVRPVRTVRPVRPVRRVRPVRAAGRVPARIICRAPSLPIHHYRPALIGGTSFTAAGQSLGAGCGGDNRYTAAAGRGGAAGRPDRPPPPPPPPTLMAAAPTDRPTDTDRHRPISVARGPADTYPRPLIRLEV